MYDTCSIKACLHNFYSESQYEEDIMKLRRACRWESNINVGGREMSCENLNLMKLVHDMESRQLCSALCLGNDDKILQRTSL